MQKVVEHNFLLQETSEDLNMDFRTDPDRQIDRHTQADRRTNRHRQTDRQTDTQAETQIEYRHLEGSQVWVDRKYVDKLQT